MDPLIRELKRINSFVIHLFNEFPFFSQILLIFQEQIYILLEHTLVNKNASRSRF